MTSRKEDTFAAVVIVRHSKTYWNPIYAYLRCRGFARPDAQDLTQTFFLRAVMGGLLNHADPSRGRLRSFLLGSLARHLADHLRHEGAEKRGGRAIVLPLECENAEDRFSNEPADRRDPEALYLAAWAQDLIDRVRGKLRKYYVDTERGELFDALNSSLSMDDDATPYADLARQFDASEAAMRLQVFRMRRRFGKLLREEVAQTVQSPAEIEEELAWLSKVLRST